VTGLGVEGIVGLFDNHLVVLAGGDVGDLVVFAKGGPVVLVAGNDLEGAMIETARAIGLAIGMELAIVTGRTVCLRHSSAVVCHRSGDGCLAWGKTGELEKICQGGVGPSRPVSPQPLVQP
jgi:hypothetical protein